MVASSARTLEPLDVGQPRGSMRRAAARSRRGRAPARRSPRGSDPRAGRREGERRRTSRRSGVPRGARRVGRRRNGARVRKRTFVSARVRTWKNGRLAGIQSSMYSKLRVLMPGMLFVVATPIGNLEDITAASVARASRGLPHRGRGHPPSCEPASTLLHLDTHDEPPRAQRSAEIGPRSSNGSERGEIVALVFDAGTPLISDPGLRLIARAR